MSKRFEVVLLVSLALVFLALAALAAPVAAQSAPTGFRADLLRDVGELETKVVRLADAVPAEKYGWRPGEGVRSISEAMMHLAAASYFFGTLFGESVPDGVDMANLEKITAPEQVRSALESSFDHLRGLIQGLPDDRLDDAMKMFGQESTVAGALHVAVAHGHEHLGQLIAYARSIGIAPPWSE